MNRKKGELIKGHFCYSCIKNVNPAIQSESNPSKTDFCIACGHRREGIISTGIIIDWLVIGKNRREG